MTLPARPERAVTVRDLCESDLDDVIRIDAIHTGLAKSTYWSSVLPGFLAHDRRQLAVGLAADGSYGMVGYLLGEVRAFEFGAEACGWVFGVGVDVEHSREGVASMLLAECCRRLRRAGVARVRTMVKRNNVPVLSFFRVNGFEAGSFVQLELDLEEKS
jgi:ribosomal protein S18 acetylase RimI-like enzyme